MHIRYIKLGDGGCWEKSCIEEENTIRLGYKSEFHQESLNGNWSAVRDYWLSCRNNDEGAATRDTNQIKDFYKLSEKDIWITFYKRRLYWCRAYSNVIEQTDGTRIRNVIGKWSCHDRKGNLLAIENIDGRITQVQGFRGTICGVKFSEYLIRRINGDIEPEVESTKASLLKLKNDIQTLIKGLWWKDFELLVDLIFARSGWQRISVLGKTEKHIDLDIFSPVTQKRAFVQIKSSTTPSELNEYCKHFQSLEQYDEAYLVYHTLSGKLSDLAAPDHRIQSWDLSRVSELVIHAGLIEWLIAKRT